MPKSTYYDYFKNYVAGATEEDIAKLPEVLREAAYIIKEEPGISITALAERIGIPTSTLSKLFKKFYEGEDIPSPPRSSGGTSGSRGGGRGGRGGAPLVMTEYTSDEQVIEQVIKARIDSKYPIAAKFIKDMSWFTHVVLDMGIVATMTMMRFLQPGDKITFKDPERDTATLLSVMQRVAALATQAGKLRTEVEQLRAENEQLREQLRELEMQRDELLVSVQRLETGLEKAREAIDKLTEMVENLTILLESQLVNKIPESTGVTRLAEA